jgi:tyrosinase
VRTEIHISNEDAGGKSYLAWAPVPATIKLVDPESDDPVDVELANEDAAHGGQLVFGTARGQPLASTLGLSLPADGSEVEFFVAGEFPKASSEDGDAVVKASVAGGGADLGTKAVMVRIRKDANTLSPAERDRFTTALAKLNDQGHGAFKDFRSMHKEPAALNQAHGDAGFLCWHRAYVLDLERELQKFDPSVALPYWRFDKPAPNMFTPEFMGVSNSLGTVTFSATNLLGFWVTEQKPGIQRSPTFDVKTQSAHSIDQFGVPHVVASDAQTLALGGMPPNAFFDRGPREPAHPEAGPAAGSFRAMEGDPHGRAHSSFQGYIHDVPTAPRDPLFFLLHCNVDRIWALWQWFNSRFDGTKADTYFYRGTAGGAGATLKGHNLHDTMWPWDGDTHPPRPTNAPRTPFRAAPAAPGPGTMPTVGDMIDYQGFLNQGTYLGYGYDELPFGIAPP